MLQCDGRALNVFVKAVKPGERNLRFQFWRQNSRFSRDHKTWPRLHSDSTVCVSQTIRTKEPQGCMAFPLPKTWSIYSVLCLQTGFLLLQLPLKLHQLAQDVLLPESRQMLKPDIYQVRPHNTPSLSILSATPLENTKDQERRRERSNRGRPRLRQTFSTAFGQKSLTQSPITKMSIHRLQQLKSTGFKSPPSHQPWEQVLLKS